MADRVRIGRVGKPHGLDGAFVVEQPSERLARGMRLLAGGEPAEVVDLKRPGNRLVVRLDRRVERGAWLEVERAELPEPPEGEFYVFQLIGLAVVEEDGRELGRVANVVEYPANDVLELDSGLALPMVDDCVKHVDLDGGRIVVATGYAGDL